MLIWVSPCQAKLSVFFSPEILGTRVIRGMVDSVVAISGRTGIFRSILGMPLTRGFGGGCNVVLVMISGLSCVKVVVRVLGGGGIV